MEALDAILTRRSVRSYNNKNIGNELINILLKTGFSAPSAGNQQPWHFIIIKDRETLDKITEILPNGQMLKKANCAIFICGDLSVEKYKGYWILDCSAATENILISARSLGLGSCWLGVYPREERIKNLKLLFNLPDHIIPFSVLSLGFTDEMQEESDRFNDERVHWEKW